MGAGKTTGSTKQLTSEKWDVMQYNWLKDKLSFAVLKKRLSVGCCWCGDIEPSIDFTPLTADEYVCSGCQDLPEVKEYIELGE